MPLHRLILEKAPKSGEWLLEWDAEALSLKSPDGQLVLELPIATAHRFVDQHELDAEIKVSFVTDAGPMTFKKNAAAARDVQELVLQGLRLDGEFREAQKRHAIRLIPLGIAAFIICGGLFSLYCWWASWAPNPEPESWIHSFGWLIHGGLLLLLGGALAAPAAIFRSAKQLTRIRRVEQSLKAESLSGNRFGAERRRSR